MPTFDDDLPSIGSSILYELLSEEDLPSVPELLADLAAARGSRLGSGAAEGW